MISLILHTLKFTLYDKCLVSRIHHYSIIQNSGELRVNKLAYRKQVSSQQVKPEKENLLVSTYSTLMKNGSKFGEIKKVSQHSGNASKVLRAKKAVEQNCNPI